MFERFAAHLLPTVLLYTLLTANSVWATGENVDMAGPGDAAKVLMSPWMHDDMPGIAIAVSRNGETIFSQGAGIANLEYNVPITPDSVFNVASVSKQFTAFSIMLLASEGKLKLDDDIRTYLPELQDLGQVTTIRNLLNHTGGYREISTLTTMAGWLDDDIRTQQQTFDIVVSQTGRNFAAGAHYEYSNTGYNLLSLIVERASGQDFASFTRQKIFTPLGMDSSFFYSDRNLIIPGRAESYAPTNSGYEKILHHSEINGSTGLFTSANDLLKWADNFSHMKVGSENTFELMSIRSNAEDGLPATAANGQELRPYNGLATWSHGGQIGGYRSFLMRVPEYNFAISIISNRADFDTAKIAFALTDIFLEGTETYEKSPEPVWAAATSGELESYAGDYEIFPGLIFTISTDGKELYFAPLNSSDKSALPQIGKHQYSLNSNTGLSLVFNVNNNGYVPSFNYTIGLHGSIPGNRIELEAFVVPSATELTDFEGSFYSKELSTVYEFAVKDGALTAKTLRRPLYNLAPYQTDTFNNATLGNFPKVEFIRDRQGRITGCLISGALANDVLFRRLSFGVQ